MAAKRQFGIFLYLSLVSHLWVLSLANAPSSNGARRPDGRRGAAYRGYVTQRLHPCEQSSCYPATGNLLIGREDRLSASSTCGLYGQERYCIVSHLEDRKKCFWCDSRPQYSNNPAYNHRIENMISRYAPGTRQRSWWQSENGVENVTIQLDLEAEFHFTHLIITFKTFRPSAMFIERSYDFGRSWHIYRYFAYDCDHSFPGIPKGPPSKITEVVCESRYSYVAPSTEGEVIFRVLPPNLPIEDPYAPEVQNLLKMTNLRINYTKLHTLGDDLLDKRLDIQEKYYYSIYEMVVRGSCSCYGHASRCLPLPGVEPRPDMVHGRCECTHHTKGLNCEHCEDFYNDWPWRPAIGRQTNACKICSCNNHAASCHFDPAVYEATLKSSGGVCDNCQHNTMGRNCDQCKPFYYEDPTRDISDPDVCTPCDCDPRGSLEDGICESHTDEDNGLIAGSCYCKTHVVGRRCDRCKNGYWNFSVDNPDGCVACTCDTQGTVDNQGCNEYTGECTCKRYVTGRDCNQCIPQYWGLSQERDGCKPCDCDPGGSFDNNCDVITGQCRCRTHVMGRSCNQPQQGFFSPVLDYMIYEAEVSRGSQNSQVVVREPYHDGRQPTWTGTGFMRVFEDSYLDFVIDNIQTSMEYDLIIRYEPQSPHTWVDVRVTVERDSPVDLDGPCANLRPGDDKLQTSLPADARHVILQPALCLEAGKRYKVKLEFRKMNPNVETPTTSLLIDSIGLIPRIDDIPFYHGSVENDHRRQEFQHYQCDTSFYGVTHPPVSDICQRHLYSIGFYVFDGASKCDCDPTGSHSSICSDLGGQCQCKTNVVGQHCDRCAPGTYGFGPEGCRPCECNSIGSLDNFCEIQSGQCRCRPNTYGRQCDQCQPGYWNFPTCQRCECHGHADLCDSGTGVCLSCRNSTEGDNCERCSKGFYGDPRIGVGIPCRSCPCPGLAEGGHSYADHCVLEPTTKDVICECLEGYAAPRCDICSDNYYGNPEVLGGSCRACNCSNNIDISRPGNCDGHTGQCLQCLFNTEGGNCEVCKPGFFGIAVEQSCAVCVCNILGTNDEEGPCNHVTGQCPCHPNITGLSCGRCAPNHWKLASGVGCEACDCDPIGSHSKQCNEYLGHCECNEGFGGRRCDQCETNHWGNPKAAQCYPCNCDSYGSSTEQCNHNNGTCECNPGVGGDRCDECAKGYLGHAPYCDPCGECFNNWDYILQELEDETTEVVISASEIQETGVTGAYTDEFVGMEQKLDSVRKILANATVSNQDLESLENYIDAVKLNLSAVQSKLDYIDDSLENTTHLISTQNGALSAVKTRITKLLKKAHDLKDNATRLKEANVDGALNSTREAWQRGKDAEAKVKNAQSVIASSKNRRKGTESVLESQGAKLNQSVLENKESLEHLQLKLDAMDNRFPPLNKLVCDHEGDPCSVTCGGAGCGSCGGTGCEEGALNKVARALEIAEDIEKSLKQKEKETEEMLRGLRLSKIEADRALSLSQAALLAAQLSQNKSGGARTNIEELLNRIDEFLDVPGAKPVEIRTLAQEVLSKAIPLKPEQIKDLADQINDRIATLSNIDAILDETAEDVNKANELKTRADRANEQAEGILDTAQKVLDTLLEAEQAQSLAQRAIGTAGEDIQEADKDLTQIPSETDDAHQKVQESLTDLSELQDRMDVMQRKVLNNRLTLNDAQAAADEAEKLAGDAEKTFGNLERAYEDASRLLRGKTGSSGGVSDRAKKLQERANELAINATSKLDDLHDMENQYIRAKNNTNSISDEISSLIKLMDSYISTIDGKSRYYRECISSY